MKVFCNTFSNTSTPTKTQKNVADSKKLNLKNIWIGCLA